MSNKLKGIILDWAGTTVDYGCFAPVVTFMEIFSDYKIQLRPDEVIKPMGIHKKEHIKALLQLDRIKKLWASEYGTEPDSSTVEELYTRFEPRLISKLKDFAEPKPYVVAVIKELKAMGLKIGSTTGYTRKMMNELVPYAEKNGYSPDCIVTSDEVVMGRPHPFMCYKNALELGIYPLETIIKVGDTIADIKEGVNASMWSVGIVLGSSLLGMTEEETEKCDPGILKQKVEKVEEKFFESGAHFVIDDIRDLPPLVGLINSKLEKSEKP